METFTVRESRFRVKCTVCRAYPTRWRIDVNAIDEYYCGRHEMNKDMRVAGLEQSPE